VELLFAFMRIEAMPKIADRSFEYKLQRSYAFNIENASDLT
jgi:hypothetical protein